MALITKSEAAKRLDRSPARITQLIKQGKIEVKRDARGREGLDEEEVENLRCYMDHGLVRGRKPSSRAGVRIPSDWREKELPPVEPDEPLEFAPAPAPRRPQPVPQPPPTKRLAELTEDDLNLFDEYGRLDPVRCRAWQEFEKARKLQTERYAVEGKYVEVAKVQPAIERAMQTIRKGVMAIESRMKAVYPDMPRGQSETLERLCREALEKAIIDYENADS